VEARGLNWPVVEVSARYLAPARYGDLVAVRTSLKEMQSRAFTIEYAIVNAETKQVLCTGWTKHLNVNNEWRAVAIPDDIRALMAD
jgi:acyl-CoA thioester hydrolase